MNGLQEHFFVLLKVQTTVLYKQVELKAAGIAPHKELPQQNNTGYCLTPSNSGTQMIRKTHIYVMTHKMRTVSSHLAAHKVHLRGTQKMSDYTESIWSCEHMLGWQSTEQY